MTGHIVFDSAELLQTWRDYGSGDDLHMVLSGDRSLAELVRIARLCVRQFNEERPDPDVIGMGSVEPTPRGAVINLGYAEYENEAAMTAMFSRLSELLEQLGVSGALQPFHNVRSPLKNLPKAAITSIDAPLSLAGKPPGRNVGHQGASWAWQSDPSALATVIDHALEWCQVPAGSHYLGSGIIEVDVEADQRRELLEISLDGSLFCDLLCTQGRAQFRTVRFDGNGHVIYCLGGEEAPAEWEQCVAELKQVLTDLAPHLDYAFMRRADTSTISWQQELARGLPSPGPSKGIPIGKSRPAEPTHLPDTFGMQLLGPSHPDVPVTAADWTVTPVDGDRRIVTAPDLAPWFAEPTVQSETVDRARDAFAPLLLTPEIADDLYQRRQQQGSEQ